MAASMRAMLGCLDFVPHALAGRLCTALILMAMQLQAWRLGSRWIWSPPGAVSAWGRAVVRRRPRPQARQGRLPPLLGGRCVPGLAARHRLVVPARVLRLGCKALVWVMVLRGLHYRWVRSAWPAVEVWVKVRSAGCMAVVWSVYCCSWAASERLPAGRVHWRC